MARELRYAPVAREAIRFLPPEVKQRIRATLRTLVNDPLGISNQFDVRRLDRPPSETRTLRVRIGDWRVVYQVDDAHLTVFRVFHRSEGYDWLDDG